MGIQIDGGITIGTGITISPPPSVLRGLLSPAGQTAYDAATTNNFFSVSAADYGNVAAGLNSVTKYVMDDTQVANTGGGGWTGGFAQAFPTATATVPAGTYVIGFIAKAYNSNGTATPLISTAFPPTATYTAIANSPTVGFSALNYYIRKAPTTATASTSYLGLVLNVTSAQCASAVYTGSGYYSTGSPYSSWTAWSTTFCNYQVLGTPTVQW